jgi:peptide/nickel transport system ATP-binding protein
MMNKLVEIQDLQVGARTDSGRDVEIIKGISFSVAPGEIVALIGESGSGKTTTALTLMGYTRPGCRITGGKVLMQGRDLVTLPETERRKLRGTDVAYIPQSAAAAFNPSKRLIDQVVEVAKIHELMSPDQARLKALELFRALALPDPDTIGNRYPHQVSGGQLQRLAAAMAMLGDPKLMIFDEPTTALDVTTQIEVLRAFKDVVRSAGMAGVYVSHDLAVVAQIADRIVVLKNGAVQETGTTEQILHAPRHPYTKELLAAFEPAPYLPVSNRESARQPVVLVENIIAGYGPILANRKPAKIALDDVSLRLEKGRNLGVIGESGSGKSTLARAIAGLLPPVSGNMQFDGRELFRNVRQRSKEELRRMQIVFQLADTALNPSRPVADILGRPLTFYHGQKETRAMRGSTSFLIWSTFPAR